MIVLPARKRIIERRNKLYRHLFDIAHCASLQQVEDIMRRIHILNKKLLTINISKYDEDND